MNPTEILFLVGVVLLLLFFVALVLRLLVVRSLGNKVLRSGTVPRQTPASDKPFRASGRVEMKEKGFAMLFLIITIVVVHGLLTEGVWGLVRALIGFIIILGLGPMVVAWFWSSTEEDGLAKVCHKLLNWSVACLTFPLLSLLG